MSFTGAFNQTGCWQAAVLSGLRSLPADRLTDSSPRQCMAPRGWHALPVLTLAVCFLRKPSPGLRVPTDWWDA